MKRLFRRFLVSTSALWLTSYALPGLVITGGTKGLLLSGLAFMLADILLIPLLKILFLPLNLLTLGLFTWVVNIIALYLLVSTIPSFQLLPYQFPGAQISGFIIPAYYLPTFYVVVVASLMIGFIIHLLNWLLK